MKINKLLAASSIAALALVSSAVAQDKSTTPARETTAATEKMDLKGTWRSTKLIGLDVYNRADEKLGDVNEILLDKDGKVKAVVVGVGGFLGMGEHDIAVSMDKLKFMEEPRRSARADTTTDAKSDNRATTGSSTAATSRNTANDWVPDHAVMDATKDQLKAMPQFKYSSYN
jgi:sporulation protein YlmC with PRC-barrel domain